MENPIIISDYRKYHIKYRIGENTFERQNTANVPLSTPIDFVEEIVVKGLAKEYSVKYAEVVILEFGLL